MTDLHLENSMLIPSSSRWLLTCFALRPFGLQSFTSKAKRLKSMPWPPPLLRTRAQIRMKQRRMMQWFLAKFPKGKIGLKHRNRLQRLKTRHRKWFRKLSLDWFGKNLWINLRYLVTPILTTVPIVIFDFFNLGLNAPKAAIFTILLVHAQVPFFF